MLAITLGTFVVTAILFQKIPKGFFPSEDIGQLTGSTVGPDDASFDAMVARQGVMAEIIKRDPDVALGDVDGGRRQRGQHGQLGPHLRHPARQAGTQGDGDRR